jgi:TolA-binding protein
MAQTPAATPAGERMKADKPRLSERIALALHKARFVFWSVFGALALMLVAYFVYSEIDKSRRERSTMLAEEVVTQYEEWKAAEAGEKRDGLQTALTEKIDTIVRKYPRQYAAQRARIVRATVLADAEKWEQSAQEYLAIAESYPKSYLAPIALFNAAVSMENAKNDKGALDAYGKIVERFPKSYLTPHALYSRGRLYEAAGDLEKAKADYTTLSDNHSASSWTSLAKNRILALKLKGR